jgi:hypothetical protein
VPYSTFRILVVNTCHMIMLKGRGIDSNVVDFCLQVKLANASHFALFLASQEVTDFRLPSLQRANQDATPLDPTAYLCDSLPESDMRAIARGQPCTKPLIMKRHVFDAVSEEAVDVKMLQLTLMQVGKALGLVYHRSTCWGIQKLQ